MKKHVCQRKTNCFGVVTVTDKGQIAIPIDLRKHYGIEKGDKLVIVKRKDDKGFNLLKLEIMGELIDQIAQD